MSKRIEWIYLKYLWSYFDINWWVPELNQKGYKRVKWILLRRKEALHIEKKAKAELRGILFSGNLDSMVVGKEMRSGAPDLSAP
jgi:hypothetical protein